ncbi:MAG: flavin reductase family protein [Candidatus Caenarcaniphilales bacterium]|nr:flavin reductase family protein [Candidatus Caenarcaniphilales bacterium]
MIINTKEKTSAENYHLMTQTIVPRPIAWVISDNGNESFNLAPFSYFNAVCTEPPLIMLSISKKKDNLGEPIKKDTWINIEERKNFVINISSVEMKDSVLKTAEALPFGQSELEYAGLETVAFDDEIIFPRLKDCKIAFYCSLFQIIELGPLPQGLILGEIHKVFVDDSIVSVADNGRVSVDPFALNPLGRLGSMTGSNVANSFCGIERVYEA